MMKPSTGRRQVKPSTGKLPKKFRGADVVRGKGMNGKMLDEFVQSNALDQFDALRETYLVIEDGALEDGHRDRGVVVRCFRDKDDALSYAQAMAAGNIDHRVLRVTGQTLVVATHNEL